jgi:RNA polymerase sigma-70 factor, ECF subfamily
MQREVKFDQLYRQYARLIYVRCRRMLGEEQAAEDATQEVFIRVAVHLQKAPSSAEARLWIYRISSNYCLNEIRNSKRRPRSVAPHENLADSGAEDLLFSRDLARRLIERMPVHLRAATWLHYVDGMSHDDVGKQLGISRRTVINHIVDFQNRARKFAE